MPTAHTAPAPPFESRIWLIRGHKVILDADLAELYQVTTGNLNLAVRRNKDRFPKDFMFQLTKEEFENLRLQIARSSWGGRRHHPQLIEAPGEEPKRRIGFPTSHGDHDSEATQEEGNES